MLVAGLAARLGTIVVEQGRADPGDAAGRYLTFAVAAVLAEVGLAVIVGDSAMARLRPVVALVALGRSAYASYQTQGYRDGTLIDAEARPPPAAEAAAPSGR